MKDDQDAIQRLENRLYSKTESTGVKPRSPLNPNDSHVPTEWETPPDEVRKEPIMYRPKKQFSLLPLFLGALLFFFAATGFAVYTFLHGGNTVSSANINLNILGPSMIDGGKEATFEITVENRNAAQLELVDLLVEYPEGTRSADDLTVALPRQRISLDTIDPGTRVKQTVRAVLFGEEGSVQRINASIEYRVAGSNAIFVKEEFLDVMIGASPVSISVKGPDESVSGQPIEYDITLRSNAQTVVKDLVFEVQYPFGFSVTNVSPETAVGDAFWRLGDLEPGKERVVHVEGILDGQDNEERIFRFLVGSQSDQTEAHIKVPYITVPHSMTLKRAFITADLTLNGDSSKTVVVSPGEMIQGKINWKNNLDTEIEDLRISATLSGQALDKASVLVSRGFYRSQDSTIIWSKDDDVVLANVPPGDSGVVDFTFTSKQSSADAVLINPEITLNVSVAGKRTSQGSVPESIQSAFTKIVRVGSQLSAQATTRHFSGPISNTGPMPPVADQETTYAVVWTIKNPSNTISNGRVSATLPAFVKYLGMVSPSNERVDYDARTNTVSWSLGDIKAQVGFGTAAREVSFKVGLTPSISQINSTPNLTSKMTVTGDDRFTGKRIQIESAAPSIRVDYNEPGYTSDMAVIRN